MPRHGHGPHGEWWAPRPGYQAWRGFGRRVFVAAASVFALLVLVLVAIGALVGTLVAEFGLVSATVLVPVLVLLVTALLFRYAVRTWRPVRDLIRAAGSLADGDYSVRVRPSGSAAMRPVAASFNEMARRLEEAEEQRRQLIADLGHELRTPLTVVRGEIEAMIDGVHRPDASHLEQLLEEVAVMERLLGDLRTLSLAAAGALTLHPEPTDLGDLVSDVATGYRRSATESGVAIAVDADPAVGEIVVDPVRIREVLANLVVNALRAMPDGGTLTLSVQTEGGEVVLAVADTGTGMEPGDIERFFERFRKGSTSSGSGLGLTISRDLVEAHGGSISIESTPGVGTVVRVRLPRLRPDRRQPRP